MSALGSHQNDPAGNEQGLPQREPGSGWTVLPPKQKKPPRTRKPSARTTELALQDVSSVLKNDNYMDCKVSQDTLTSFFSKCLIEAQKCFNSDERLRLKMESFATEDDVVRFISTIAPRMDEAMMQLAKCKFDSSDDAFLALNMFIRSFVPNMDAHRKEKRIRNSCQ